MEWCVNITDSCSYIYMHINDVANNVTVIRMT
jgi:hypothetical protein